VDTQAELTILKPHGKITGGDILQAFEEFYTHSPTIKLLWDFSETDMSAVSSADLKKIAIHTKQYAQLRPKGKTAWYGNDDLSFGLSRQYTTLAELEDHSIRFASFRNYDEAMDWLQNNE